MAPELENLLNMTNDVMIKIKQKSKTRPLSDVYTTHK